MCEIQRNKADYRLCALERSRINILFRVLEPDLSSHWYEACALNHAHRMWSIGN